MANPRIEELPDEPENNVVAKVEDAGDESSDSEVEVGGEGGMCCFCDL